MIRNISIDIDEVLKNLNRSDQWDLLQLLWNELLENGMEQDWDSFYSDNNIKKV
jgi:hypothetical protein